VVYLILKVVQSKPAQDKFRAMYLDDMAPQSHDVSAIVRDPLLNQTKPLQILILDQAIAGILQIVHSRLII
jgi:hypothetical protein